MRNREKTLHKQLFLRRRHSKMSRSEASMLHVAHGEKMSDQPALHLMDCQTLTATQLRRKYRREANSHRNMQHREKAEGRKVHPAFKVFRNFLTHVGPCPWPGATLDRINNSDPEYAPGKVQWADKRTQNSNKRDTLLFRSRTKDVYTASQLAKRQGVSTGAIRKRLERGWKDDEIIEGHSHGTPVNDEHSYRKSVRRDRKHPHVQAGHLRPARDIMWERNARDAARHREEYGEEYCLNDFELIRDTAAECEPKIIVTREGYERKFAKWWPQWKPHLIRERLPEWAQELIAKIEGTTVADIRCCQEKMRDLV